MNLQEEIVVGLPVKNTTVDQLDFPSKIGGTPKWLALQGYPKPECKECKKPMQYLLQVYCPLEEIDEAYYRTVYLFVCNEEKCRNKDHSIRVYRNQLPRENKYYIENEEEDTIEIKGENAVLPPEYILTKNTYEIETVIIDPEDTKKIEEAIKNGPKPGEIDDDDDDDEEDESKTSEDFRHENELLKQYFEEEKDSEFREMGTDFNALADDLDKAAKDEKFTRFTRFIESYPNQILRYCRSEASEPLWITDLKVPDVTKVPKCEACGAKRVFEFQINCQILNYIPELIVLDWGVIAVYTCSKSCSKSQEDYKEEYIVLQLNAQEQELDEKALRQILAEKKEEGPKKDDQEKKKKKKKKNKKTQPGEETKGSDDEDDKAIKEAQAEEDAHSESDWM